MKLRPLLIDEPLRAQVAKVMAFAEAHPYLPGPGIDPPGENPNYCLNIPVGYRCVFSFTEIAGEGRYRDLSISVSTAGKYPNAFALFTLAELFGFSGWDGKSIQPLPEGWLLAKDIGDEAIRVAQRME